MESPYSLGSDGSNPVQFYTDLGKFTDVVVQKWEPVFDDFIFSFQTFAVERNWKAYSGQEYLMEILMLGVFDKHYASYVSGRVNLLLPVCRSLFSLRKKNERIKPFVDRVRGVIATQLLLRQVRKPQYGRYKLLLKWLDCTNEFSQEVGRLNCWIKWLSKQSADRQEIFGQKCFVFAEWFLTEANNCLGSYTLGQTLFVTKHEKLYRNREDHIFCMRPEGDYHLNMVAAEVMNRTLLGKFKNTENKILLLPTCMSKRGSCAATIENGQLLCRSCADDCRVSKLKKKMQLQHVQVVLIPHSSGFSKYLEPWKGSETTALIGVACVLNLLTGGYEMQNLQIPAQCIFLDQCGCQKHWNAKAPATLNEMRLEQLLAN